MVIWTRELTRALALLLNTKGRYKLGEWVGERPLWVEVLKEDWERIRKMIRVIRDHKIWAERTNNEVVSAIASTKQKHWEEILLLGRLPGRQESFMPPLEQNFIFQGCLA